MILIFLPVSDQINVMNNLPVYMTHLHLLFVVEVESPLDIDP